MVLYLYIGLVCYLPIIDDFFPKTDFGKGIPDIGPYRLGLLLLFLVVIMHGVIKKDIKVFSKWIGILIIFYCIVVASISWSFYSYNSSTAQDIFSSVFAPFLCAFIAMNLFEKEEITQVYFKHIIIAVLIMSMISAFQLVSGFLTGFKDVRSVGTFGNPNILALVLVFTIPCILYTTEKQIISGIFSKVVNISVIIGIVCTVSRKGIITMVLCYLLIHFLRKNYKRMVVIFVGFAIVAVMLSGYSVISHRFAKDKFEAQLSEKWTMTRTGWEMFKTSPIRGLGYKGYYENFGIFNPNPVKEKYDAHNIYITALANYGIVGFIPFIAIFIYPLMRAVLEIRQGRRSSDFDHSFHMATICLISLVGFMINGWFGGNLFYHPHAMTLLYNNIAIFLAIRQRNPLSRTLKI